jgi:hypothetical protein
MSESLIVQQIEEGMMLWKQSVGIVPNTCYLGVEQINEWAQQANEDLTSLDIAIVAVRAQSYLGFGV